MIMKIAKKAQTRMTRLASPLDRMLPRYDAVVVGSGYGGGVAASRLARMGKRVAVLERGRELVTGEFPARFPDLRGEMQLAGKQVRLGSPTGLYDVRFGADMHVLVGCGLGGGSLINAGVALRPDPRVFRDSVWPGQIVQDGLIDEGFARAARWVRPARDPAAATWTKYKALEGAGRALGQGPVAAPVVVSFEDCVNPAGIAQPACTRCGDCCGGCNVGAKNTVALTYLPDAVRHGADIFTHARVRHVSRSGDGRWQVHFERLNGAGAEGPSSVAADMVVLAAGTLGSTEILLRSRERGLALSDRLGDPLLGQRRHHRLRLRRQDPGQRHRRRPSAEGGRYRGGCLRLGPDRDRRRDGRHQEPHHPGGRAAVGAGPDPARAVHPQRPPAGRAEEPDRRRLQGAVRGPADVLCRVARQRLGAAGAGGRPAGAVLARRQGRAGLPASRCGARGAGAAVPAAATSRTRSPAP